MTNDPMTQWLNDHDPPASVWSARMLPSGAIAQLGERIVRNDEVVGSIPTSSTKVFSAHSRTA